MSQQRRSAILRPHRLSRSAAAARGNSTGDADIAVFHGRFGTRCGEAIALRSAFSGVHAIDEKGEHAEGHTNCTLDDGINSRSIAPTVAVMRGSASSA
jgi:hypothetical protein